MIKDSINKIDSKVWLLAIIPAVPFMLAIGISAWNTQSIELLVQRMAILLFVIGIGLVATKIASYAIIKQNLQEIDKLDQAKSDFIAMASHQLRTPLTAITWTSELLIDGEVGALSDEQKKQLQEINDSSKNMSALVGELLDLSRLDMNKFEQDNQLFSITELANDILNELDIDIKSKKITVTKSINVDEKLMFDEKWYRMILLNLLSNGVKYTRDDGNIELEIKKLPMRTSVAGRRLDSDSLYIKVADDGYGIPADQQKQIFQRMFRASNVKNSKAGTGLGLYIIKEIITKSKGDIWFDSTDGKGTTFHVILPIIKNTKSKG